MLKQQGGDGLQLLGEQGGLDEGTAQEEAGLLWHFPAHRVALVKGCMLGEVGDGRTCG